MTKDDWSHYDAVTAAQASGKLEDALRLRDKLPDAQFARVAGGEWAEILKFRIVTKQLQGSPWLLITAAMAKLRALKAELAGPNPTAVELTLADLIVIAWADYHRCAGMRENSCDCTLRQLAYQDARLDRAHKRLLRSLRSLAAVRKVPLTAIQVNFDGMADVLARLKGPDSLEGETP